VCGHLDLLEVLLGCIRQFHFIAQFFAITLPKHDLRCDSKIKMKKKFFWFAKSQKKKIRVDSGLKPGIHIYSLFPVLIKTFQKIKKNGKDHA